MYRCIAPPADVKILLTHYRKKNRSSLPLTAHRRSRPQHPNVQSSPDMLCSLKIPGIQSSSIAGEHVSYSLALYISFVANLKVRPKVTAIVC